MSSIPMSPRRLPILLTVLVLLLAPVLAAGLLPGLPLVARDASAATPRAWPRQAIRVVVPWAAGVASDAGSMAAMLAEALAHQLGQPVVLDHRPGLGGGLAAEIVARSPADGHTVLLGSGDLLLACLLQARDRGPGCDLEEDLAPVTLLALSDSVLVTANRPDAPVTFAELAGRPSAGAGLPGRSYASAGSGSASHLAAEHLRVIGGLDAEHRPHRDLTAAVGALLQGRADFMVVPLGVAQAGIRSGTLRPLAVTGGARSFVLPSVPHLGESGAAGLRLQDWLALWSPPETPAAIRQALQAAVASVLDRQELIDAWNSRGAEQGGQPARVLELLVRSETLKWRRTIGAPGISGSGRTQQ